MADAVTFGMFTAEPLLLDAFNRGESQGFPLFGPAHLIWIALCAVLVLVAVRWYRHLFKRELSQSSHHIGHLSDSGDRSDLHHRLGCCDPNDSRGSSTLNKPYGSRDSCKRVPFRRMHSGTCLHEGDAMVGGARRERTRRGSGSTRTAATYNTAPSSLWFLRGMALIMLLGLVSEDYLKVSAQVFTAPWWPLHWCNFAELFCVIYAIWPNRFCRELLLTVGLAGGFTAVLFPAWSYCPPYTWPVISGFVQHALIFAISLCAVSDWRTAPRWRDLWMTAAFVAAYAVFFRWFNGVFSTNFGFVTTPVAGTPLAWWAASFGNPGYLVPFACAFACGALTLHGAVALQRRMGYKRGSVRR